MTSAKINKIKKMAENIVVKNIIYTNEALRGSFLIFEGSFLHFGGEIAPSPRVIFSPTTCH